MSVVGGGFFFLIGLFYLAVIAGAIVAVVLTVRALMQTAHALQRIADALERRPPS